MIIQGIFSGIKNANQAVQELNASGIKAYTTLNENNSFDNHQNTPGSGTGYSLSNLVFFGGSPMDTGSNPMLASNPMVSGIGNYEEILDSSYKVVVETEEINKNQAMQILKNYGGEI